MTGKQAANHYDRSSLNSILQIFCKIPPDGQVLSQPGTNMQTQKKLQISLYKKMQLQIDKD